MRDVTQVVQYVNLVLYAGAAVAAVVHWRRHRAEAGLWAALAFAALAIFVNVRQLLPVVPEEPWEQVAFRLVVALLVLFPFLLYRFASAFVPPGRRLSLVVAASTLVVLVWTFAQPSFPGPDEPRPPAFAAYVVAFTLHWTVLASIVAWRLWTAGRGETSVARRRMRLLAVAAAAITLALVISVSVRDVDSAARLAAQLLSSVSALAFLVGLTPPALLRAAWRRPEQQQLQTAIAELMRATTQQEVVEQVLPSVTAIVGARGAVLRDSNGDVLGFHPADPAIVERIDAPAAADGRTRRVLVPPEGELAILTSPYAPFFGGEELRLLRTLASLTGLALDRSRLFAQERDARLAIERADELKTNFIALAAHELRTPVAAIHGLVETIHLRRDGLTDEQLAHLERTLREQTTRMKSLVEQLLDLSRLDAHAIRIAPQPIEIRRRVEELVSATAGARAGDVEIAVSDELEVEVDPNAFDRIVSNLVTNALRYGRPPVVVNAVASDRHFRLTVEDHGEGVAQEFVPALFERFARSERSRGEGGGTGLGLAIARSYAHAHRGELLYEPAEPKGARFELVLPLERRPS